MQRLSRPLISCILKAWGKCCSLTSGQHEEEYRRQLGRYGVIGDLAIRPVRSLSGGQKSRVVMALMSMRRWEDVGDLTGVKYQRSFSLSKLSVL